MSDYLVTSTELTETADAIRAKTGDSNLIEWESGTGFADAVAAIPSGGGESPMSESKYLSVMKLIAIADYQPAEITVDAEHLYYFGLPSDWNIDSGLRRVIFKNLRRIQTGQSVPGNPQNFTVFNSYVNRGVQYIDLGGTVVVNNQNNRFFQYCYDLKRIDGVMDFSEVTAWTYGSWFLTTPIEHMSFAPNSAVTVEVLDFDNCSSIDDDTLISIANMCYENPANTRTLKLHSSKKTRANSLLGNVTTAQGGYSLFEADPNGATTLSNFITSVKGWTIA